MKRHPVKVNAETLTDERLVHALARFHVADHFVFGSPRLSSELAKFVGYNPKGVSADVVRELMARGWLSSPAAGQRRVTDIGRIRIAAAIDLAKDGK